MPSQNPRVALTLPKDLDDVLQELSDLQKIPKTKLITELLLEFKPFFEQSAGVLKKIKNDRENAEFIAKTYVSETLLRANTLIGDLAKEVSDK